MSALKSRVNKLICRNYVFFSNPELTFITDFFKAYLDEENTEKADYSKECRALELCAEKYFRDGSCDYPAKLNELAKRDFLAYNAFMHQAHVRFCDKYPDGVWLSEPAMIKTFLERFERAKHFFEMDRKS